MDDRYVAGLFDGEGVVRINRKQRGVHRGYNLHVAIGMNYYPVVKALCDAYGGSVHMNRHDLRNPKNRIQFSWIVANQKAATFLRRILPFAIVKLDEIVIALKLQDHIDANPYISAGRNHMLERKNRDKILAYREELCIQISALKKRSFPPLTE